MEKEVMVVVVVQEKAVDESGASFIFEASLSLKGAGDTGYLLQEASDQVVRELESRVAAWRDKMRVMADDLKRGEQLSELYVQLSKYSPPHTDEKLLELVTLRAKALWVIDFISDESLAHRWENLIDGLYRKVGGVDVCYEDGGAYYVKDGEPRWLEKRYDSDDT